MSSLAALQQAFAGHLRDPRNLPPPAGIEARRMRIYEDLVYNTVEGFLVAAFPVLRSLLDDAAWHGMVRAFLASHRCRTPYFPRVSEEFVDWCADVSAHPELPAFLHELVHYEWVEHALYVAPDAAQDSDVDADGDPATGVPVLNPQLFVLDYAWPVHRICRDHRPTDAPSQPTRLVVYRDRNLDVKFIESNAWTHRLLGLLASGCLAGDAALAQLCAEAGRPDDATLLAAGRATLARLRALGVIVGTRAAD